MDLKISSPCSILILMTGISTINILDSQNRIYYERTFGKSVDKAVVNIPDPGNYKLTVNGKDTGFSVSEIPLQFQRINKSLPPYERSRFKPYSIKKNFNLHNTPARINTFLGEIETGPRFDSFPLYCQKFIIAHEVGHFFYKTEEYADFYAAKKMLDAGYNPTSIANALRKCLKRSDLATKRIIDMIENLTS